VEFDEKEELKYIEHTPAGYEGPKLLGEVLEDAMVMKGLDDFDEMLDREDLEQSKLRWGKLYVELGYEGVAAQLMKDEIETLYVGRDTLNADDVHWTSQVMIDILESTYPRLLQ
jgi:hypothetical protein